MGERHRVIRLGRFALGLALLAAAAAAGCRNRSGDGAPPPPASAAPPPRAAVDQVLPGEIAEGSDKAFGFPIPRRMRVRARFPDTIYAAGNIPAERLANYVRQRVVAQGVETGPAKTVFSRATMKDAPQRMLRIEVIARTSATELVIRDRTPPPPSGEQGLSEEERWRRKGLKPDGSPLDPTHLE